MKRLFAAFAVLVAALSASAQQKQPVYLFPDYQEGEFFLGGSHRPQRARLNIDALGQRVFYFQGETLMELTQLHRLDSIRVGGHTFVVKDALLCEQVTVEGNPVWVNWKFDKVHKGSTGAMGITTQNNVEVLWTNPNDEPSAGEGRYGSTGAFSPEVWENRSNNTYFFALDGKEYRVRRVKDLYRAFPEQAPALKAFVKENRYSMNNAQQALRILARLFRL